MLTISVSSTCSQPSLVLTRREESIALVRWYMVRAYSFCRPSVNSLRTPQLSFKGTHTMTEG